MLKNLFRAFSLVLCVAMLCSTILCSAAFAADNRKAAAEERVSHAVSHMTSGAIYGAATMSMGVDDYGSGWFTTFEELKTLVSESYSDYMYYYFAEYELVITESITIPTNLEVFASKLVIPEGVTVTVEGILGSFELDLRGTLDNRWLTCIYGESDVRGKLINRDTVVIVADAGAYLNFVGGEYIEKRPCAMSVSGSSEEILSGRVTGLNMYDFAYEYYYNEYEDGVFYTDVMYDYFNSDVKPVAGASVPMFRMYDSNGGEHFYTGSTQERYDLINAGWYYEGVGFNFPASGEPVYRLYHQPTGEHLYTMDVTEKNTLINAGWTEEGVAFNSAGSDEVAQYRLHNPNATRGAYHFTGSAEERDQLISLGWEDQGIGWFSCLR